MGPHLLALLLKLAGGVDHVGDPTMTTEAALAFRQKTLFQVIIQAVEKDASGDLPGDVQKGVALLVVSDLAVSLPLVEMHDCGVFEILRDFSLTPHFLEERRQMDNESRATLPVDLSRDRVRSGRFPAGELLHHADAFVERRREVEVDVGLHLWQTADGGVGNGGGTVEDA
nr:unnamed protein product [Spirometra erinaceieuropaei]